jgi:arylformamidase
VIEKNILPFIDTGVAHKEPGIGQIGAGVLKRPAEPFQKALRGFRQKLKPRKERQPMNTKQFLQFMDKVRVYDLTQPLSIHTPPWPSYMPLGIQYFKRIAGAHMGQGANGQIITTSNHVGTHMDGEIHFHSSGRSIGKVPIEEWIGPGVVVDISKEVGDYDLYYARDDHEERRGQEGRHSDHQYRLPPLCLGPETVGRAALFREAPGPRPRLPPMGARHEAQMDRRGLRQRGPPDEHHHPQLAPGALRRSREETEGEVRQGWDEMFPPDEYYQVMHLKLFPKKLVHAENVGGEIDKVSNQRAWIGAFPLNGIEMESCHVPHCGDDYVPPVNTVARYGRSNSRMASLRSARWSHSATCEIPRSLRRSFL